jgi:putative nucleotidyltransferase-like protein
MASDDSTQSERTDAAARRLRIDAATIEVLDAFAMAGVEALVLKGPSLMGWLYTPEDARPYLDSDLLVHPEQERGAGEILSGLGFALERDDTQQPEWWLEHDAPWFRAEDAVRIDLHRYLDGIGVNPETAWAIFYASAESIPLAGTDAPALGLSARLLNVVLHAAQHGEAWAVATAHVERAMARVDEQLWIEAAELASELHATDAFVAGLRLAPEGAALADRLGLPAVRSVQVALRAATAPPVALGLEQIVSANGLRTRVAIVWRKFFPPREFIVHWYPYAAKSRTSLVLAYVRRPFWLLRRAPRGFRAWRAARRQVRDR